MFPTVTVYEDRFPNDRKPPPIQSYTGPKVLDAREPHYVVDLDAGSFRVVWELLESEARFRFPAHDSMSSVKALLRAVTSFRECYWAAHPPPEPEPRKKLIRRSVR